MTEQDKKLLFRTLWLLVQFSAMLLGRYVSSLDPVMRADYYSLKNDLEARMK